MLAQRVNGGAAFGSPGIAPSWTSSAKDLVTTALGPTRLWATIGLGILTEVDWPSTGTPQVRDLGFIIAGKGGSWVEVKRAGRYRISTPDPQVPLPCVEHEGEGYRLTLEFLPAPLRDALLVSYRLEGEGLRLYPLLAPHLGGTGFGNTGWVADGLYARRGEHALCLLSDQELGRTSCGYVGNSDGWQDFARHGEMTWEFDHATGGNVALIGELPTKAGVLALGFAESASGARTVAASALAEGYRSIRHRFVEGWQQWAGCLTLPKAPLALEHEAKVSAAVLKVHEDRTYPGRSLPASRSPGATRATTPAATTSSGRETPSRPGSHCAQQATETAPAG